MPSSSNLVVNCLFFLTENFRLCLSECSMCRLSTLRKDFESSVFQFSFSDFFKGFWKFLNFFFDKRTFFLFFF